MRSLFFILLFLGVSSAQEIRSAIDTSDFRPIRFDSASTHGEISDWVSSNWIRPGTTKIERVGYVVGVSLVCSLFDYTFYNYIKYSTNPPMLKAPIYYRATQLLLQAGLSYFLYKQCGLSSVASFNLIWWTWGGDFMYYGWANLINPSRPWENRSYNGIKNSDNVTWASWTPVGLLRSPKSSIAWDVLIPQSVIGFSISMYIN